LATTLHHSGPRSPNREHSPPLSTTLAKTAERKKKPTARNVYLKIRYYYLDRISRLHLQLHVCYVQFSCACAHALPFISKIAWRAKFPDAPAHLCSKRFRNFPGRKQSNAVDCSTTLTQRHQNGAKTSFQPRAHNCMPTTTTTTTTTTRHFKAKPRDLSTMALRQLSFAEFLELGLDIAGYTERSLQVRV
jgi:hypothetical protein